MKKPLTQTKVTVKLRKAAQNDRWYLMVEAYPVKDDSGKPRRIVVSVNRTITTPMFASLRRHAPVNTSLSATAMASLCVIL